MMENATGSYFIHSDGYLGTHGKIDDTHTPTTTTTKKRNNKANRADAFDDVENWICAWQSNKNRNEYKDEEKKKRITKTITISSE